MYLRPAWSTEQVSRQPRLYRKTLSQSTRGGGGDVVGGEGNTKLFFINSEVYYILQSCIKYMWLV